MTSLARTLASALSTLVFAGCYTTATGSGDAGVPPSPDARRGTDAPLLTPRCVDAPILGLDTTESIDIAQAVLPEEGSCWSSSEEPYVFRRIEVPPLTGVEIRTDGVDAPVVHLHESCAPQGGEDRCVRFGPSGFFGPGERERTTYYGNPERTPRLLYVSFWWVGEGETPFTVTTRSGSVAEHGACDQPSSLVPGELRAAETSRGGTYESWSCWYLPESHFYDVEVPARHVAVPLEGSQLLRATGGCDCAALTSPDPLVNLTNEPQVLHLEAEPSQAIGVRFEPLPSVAVCEDAEVLPLDGVTRPLARFPRLIAGLGECAYNDPHYYSVEIPARRSVEIEASLLTPYPTLQLLSRCRSGEECTYPEVLERGDSRLVAVIPNDGDTTLVQLVVVGSEGPAEGPLEGTLSARLLD
jgi:hypothetical protein